MTVGTHKFSIALASNDTGFKLNKTEFSYEIEKRDITITGDDIMYYNGSVWTKDVSDFRLVNTVNGIYATGTISTISSRVGSYNFGSMFDANVIFYDALNNDVTNCINMLYDMNVIIKYPPIDYSISGDYTIDDMGVYHVDYEFDREEHSVVVTPELKGATVMYNYNGRNTLLPASLTHVGSIEIVFTITKNSNIINT